MSEEEHFPSTPPEAWKPARELALRVVRPIERFLHVQAASGILLLIATAAALIVANSPYAEAYEALWHTEVVIGLGPWVLREPLHFWINDGLMAIFFFVVGLEIRRELHEGELAEIRRASLPVAAAVGGMIAPALIYLATNPDGVTRPGWGIPTATDIAFAVGVLALLGKRVPPAVRVLLLALAIIDDLGAIMIIAFFYSKGVVWLGLLVAAVGIALVVVMQRLGVRNSLLYVFPGAVIWSGMLYANVHPTLAGVVLGLLTPVRSWFGEEGFLAVARDALEQFRLRIDRDGHEKHDLVGPLSRLAEAGREALPPVVLLENLLHPWVSYVIMPIFAFANAGISLSGFDASNAAALRVTIGVALGLLVGKPLGILAACVLATKLRIAVMPRGIGGKGLLLVGVVAGIGFTMAIFIADLALPEGPLLVAAKLGVLGASALAAVFALALGRVFFRGIPKGAAQTESEAEASAEV